MWPYVFLSFPAKQTLSNRQATWAIKIIPVRITRTCQRTLLNPLSRGIFHTYTRALARAHAHTHTHTRTHTHTHLILTFSENGATWCTITRKSNDIKNKSLSHGKQTKGKGLNKHKGWYIRLVQAYTQRRGNVNSPVKGMLTFCISYPESIASMVSSRDLTNDWYCKSNTPCFCHESQQQAWKDNSHYHLQLFNLERRTGLFAKRFHYNKSWRKGVEQSAAYSKYNKRYVSSGIWQSLALMKEFHSLPAQEVTQQRDYGSLTRKTRLKHESRARN